MNFYYVLNNKDFIDCEIDIEPASGDGWEEPFIPETFTLIRAEVKGVDITDLISEDSVKLIEHEAEKYFRYLKDDIDD